MERLIFDDYWLQWHSGSNQAEDFIQLDCIGKLLVKNPTVKDRDLIARIVAGAKFRIVFEELD